MKTKILLVSLALNVLLLLGMALSAISFSQQKEAAWYNGFTGFCLHAPSQPGIAQSLPMYYEAECKDMLKQAKRMDLYNTLIVPFSIPEAEGSNG